MSFVCIKGFVLMVDFFEYLGIGKVFSVFLGNYFIDIDEDEVIVVGNVLLL